MTDYNRMGVGYIVLGTWYYQCFRGFFFACNMIYPIKKNAEVISKSLRKAGGASAAANKIEKVCNESLDMN
ncbi:hypothetical protein FDA36_04055 [Clostridium botulinum]|nr:hypothetical protein [Clostridium botulinum]